MSNSRYPNNCSSSPVVFGLLRCTGWRHCEL